MLLPTTVVLEKRNGRVALEESLLAQRAAELHIPVQWGTEKQASRNQIKLDGQTLVAGGVPFVKHCLRAYGKTLSEHTPYPACLVHLLYRNIKQLSTLAEAKLMIAKGQKLFVKPANWKRFTGFVTIDPMDFRFNGTSDRIPVFVAEPVEFLSEWRVYVANGVVLDIKFADHGGDRNLRPDEAVIHDAVNRLTVWGAPDGYVVDFGVLSTGETALVELNDGFSIGAYDGVTAETYWEVILSRWLQLIKP